MGDSVKRLFPAMLEIAFKSRRLAGTAIFVWGCYSLFNLATTDAASRVALILAAAFVAGCWVISQGGVEMELVEHTGKDPEDETGTTVKTSGSASVSVVPAAPVEVKP